ncbi:Smr/MutS family protein [Chitinophaga solisilvae]|uniref:Smr/MutS family protein n=1 Tax=Chitinophaga solisilvae TaxID=1233460 RepID=A0A3S1CYI7_9BACT|nr:Smr/MutS family protein [Chitinophaga solisilvae]NSL86721.1 Smr/MutS family protein [Chitinophaga solisilvae]
MKYQTGDRILLLSSKEEGTVVDIINDNMVMIEVKGTSFPVYLDQIDFPYFHRFTQQKLVKEKPRQIPGDEIKVDRKKYEVFKTDKGMFMSVLPVYQMDGYDETVKLMKFHLFNDTPHAMRFYFQIWLNNQMDLEIKNEIQPYNHFYLADLIFESLNDNPRFEFTFFLKEPQPKLAPSVKKTWKIKPKQMFMQLQELRSKEEATLTYPLFEKYPEKEAEPTPPPASASAPAGKKAAPIKTVGSGNFASLLSKIQLQPETSLEPKHEVDLHIEVLEKNWKGLSNIAILAIQLNAFQRYLELAISHHQHSMIVIHGVGKGKLRDEIHNILKQTPEVNTFVNQYHGKYGYGATEITFK